MCDESDVNLQCYKVIYFSHKSSFSLLKIYCKLIYDYGSLYIVVPNLIEIFLYETKDAIRTLKILYIKLQALFIK